jgi:two-component system chemotaxis response regulator CheB
VGGSDGGLDAYICLLRWLPVDIGAALVVVNHLRVVVIAAIKCSGTYVDWY